MTTPAPTASTWVFTGDYIDMDGHTTKQERLNWLKDELVIAYDAAKKGKYSNSEVKEFEKNAKTDLDKLAIEIYSRTYQPRPSTAFIINKPIKREIFAAAFRDRIVHHLLFNQVESWWDARFIADNYSCRKGKGTLYGVKRLSKHMRAASDNYSKETYVLKLDLQGYFMSLNRKKIYDRAIWGLDRQFPEKGFEYQTCKYLWKVIIFNDPIKGAIVKCPRSAWKGLLASKSLFRQPKGQGIAIGNLTSQLISNIYLDQLDRFVTFDLGYKHYGRYVDDFYLVSNSKDNLVKDTKKIEKYLESELGLVLHPNKRYLQNIEKGVAFFGAVIYPYRIQPGKRLKTNMKKALEDLNCSEATEASYRGLVKHYKNFRLLVYKIDVVCREVCEIDGKLLTAVYNNKGIRWKSG